MKNIARFLSILFILGMVSVSCDYVETSNVSADSQSAVADSKAVVGGGSLKLIVPAYWYPGNANWTALQGYATQMGWGRVWAIANPNSGPGTAKDSNYVTQINAFRAAGGKILGYVSTSYGARAVSAVNTDINNWYNFYSIDGIFFDEQATAWDSDYATWCTTVRGRQSGALVVGNAGTDYNMSTLYYDWMNVVVLWEKSYSGFLSYVPPTWIKNKGGDRSAALLCNMTSYDRSYTQRCYDQKMYYITMFHGGTWDWAWGLPSYFASLVNDIK